MRIKPLTWSYEVGVAGFEPTTSSSRTKRAAKLRYTPIVAPAAFAALATSITLADPRPETKSGLRAGGAGGRGARPGCRAAAVRRDRRAHGARCGGPVRRRKSAAAPGPRPVEPGDLWAPLPGARRRRDRRRPRPGVRSDGEGAQADGRRPTRALDGESRRGRGADPGAAERRDGPALAHPCVFGVSVRSVASGGHAKRTGVNRLVPQPAETCRYARWPPASCVERPFTRFVSRSQLVTSAP